MKSLIPIRGTHLYVEDFNDFSDSHEEVLLYLHGGPGASCVDFCYQQAEALSRQVRVVALDQRGVLRSDAIKEHETFGIQDIIEDCEALRIRMGIKRWSVFRSSTSLMTKHYSCCMEEKKRPFLLKVKRLYGTQVWNR